MFYVLCTHRFYVNESVTSLIAGTKCQAGGYIREEGFKYFELELIVRLWGNPGQQDCKTARGEGFTVRMWRVGRRLGQVTKQPLFDRLLITYFLKQRSIS